MSPIENLSITCDKEDAFSEGDAITGVLSFNLTKDTKVKSVSVKAKGEAYCSWTEGSGDDERSYSAHKTYFKDKQFVVPENATGEPQECPLCLNAAHYVVMLIFFNRK